jgi:hypothetical protein
MIIFRPAAILLLYVIKKKINLLVSSNIKAVTGQ